MTRRPYSRQYARADKRLIFDALDKLSNGDNVSMEQLFERVACVAPVKVSAMGVVTLDGDDDFYAWAGGEITPIGGGPRSPKAFASILTIRAVLSASEDVQGDE
jgi:hypothetical protein